MTRKIGNMMRSRSTTAMRPLTLPEAARRLGVSRQQVWRLMKSGRLPATYARGRHWVLPEHLALFMQVPRPVGRPRKLTRAERMTYDRTPRRYGGRYDHLFPKDAVQEALRRAVSRGSWHR